MRHFGFLSSTCKRKHLKRLQEQLGKPKFFTKKKKLEHLLCPICKKGKLETVCVFKDRLSCGKPYGMAPKALVRAG